MPEVESTNRESETLQQLENLQDLRNLPLSASSKGRLSGNGVVRGQILQVKGPEVLKYVISKGRVWSLFRGVLEDGRMMKARIKPERPSHFQWPLLSL